MKLFLNALFILLPLSIFSQSDSTAFKYNNGIGINLTNSEAEGLGMSLRYTRQLNNRGKLKFEFNTNLSYSYVGRMGYEFLLLRKNKFEIGIGLDLKYKYKDYTRFGQEDFKELALELPIELRYQLAPNYSIMTGLSLSQRLSSNYGNSSRKTPSEFRIGIGYHF